MKLILTIISILSFISLAVFGFFAMGEMNENHVSCLAAEIQNGKCPATLTLFSFADFHLSAFRVFSNAVFNENVLFLVLVAAAFLAFAVGSIFKSRFSPSSFLTLWRLILKKFRDFKISRDFLRWLSFKEKSPTSVFGARV